VFSYPSNTYLSYSNSCLRKQLLSRLEYYKRVNGGLSPIPKSLLDRYRYYEERYLVVQIVMYDLERFYDYKPEEDSDYEPTLYRLMKADLARVPLPAALAAWLSWDDWRFTNELAEIDLSYGLVLDYPQPLIRSASFVAGLTKTEELDECIPLETQKRADKFAIQEVLKHATEPEEEILQRLSLSRKLILQA
jgi:hypothetical protein